MKYDYLIGSARSDENGKFSGGKRGDSKQVSDVLDIDKGEVSLQKFYKHKKGWYIIRPAESIRHQIAERMLTACNNAHIGYSQTDRNSIHTFGINTNIDANCDCSSLVNQCICEVINQQVPRFTTLNQKKVILAHFPQYFTDEGEYTDSTELEVGDILVTKTQGHTVIVIEKKPQIQVVTKEPDPEKATVIHMVTRGDTLSKIARTHKTTIKAILEKNKKQYPKISKDYIEIGWLLEV